MDGNPVHQQSSARVHFNLNVPKTELTPMLFEEAEDGDTVARALSFVCIHVGTFVIHSCIRSRVNNLLCVQASTLALVGPNECTLPHLLVMIPAFEVRSQVTISHGVTAIWYYR